MRLWHKDLIPVLPRQQLLGQWRECCLIAKNVSELGTPNHILVNRIMDYPINHFIFYSKLVAMMLMTRGYKCDSSKFDKYSLEYTIEDCPPIPYLKLFYQWHNDRYYYQCMANLEEKYDCGGITDKEWYILSR